MHNRTYLSLFIFSAILIIISVSLILSNHIQPAGIFLVSAFIVLSFAIRGYSTLRGFSYTLWIFAAVTASMFYPKYFISIGNFQLKTLIVPLLQLIMFGMGSQMSAKDFAGIIKMPKGVIIGIFLQFTIMPLVGLTIANIFNFPAEIAAGIILIGCVPSGLASNVMSFLARANLALAVTLSSVTTVLSPLVTPFLMKTLAGQFIEVNFWSMMLDILNMIILPVVAGFTFNLVAKRSESHKSAVIQIIIFISVILVTTLVYTKSTNTGFSGFVVRFLKSLGWFMLLPAAGALILSKYLKGDSRIMEQVLSFFSMAGIAMIITIITASGRESLLHVGLLLLLTSLLHNLTGYTLGYFFAWLTGMPERDRRTIAFEVGMQNGGLASGLALQMGKLATVG
ncbi:MAG TPA: bile acid:sodium symporter family protein, partial [Bacteroidales bacterium]|nr:bile acid:sodium symporter family protein [Bacteroidales bacterium]HRT48812.1 bile acid:sodium symporter family protein [Bacteroidales bacterium]HRU57759.1 bile acid:sodium symporter family protein [Bacteroidales bacterium]